MVLCGSFCPGALSLSAGGYLQTCTLLKFGGVYCWGNNDNGQLGTGDTNARLTPTAVIGLAKGGLNSFQLYARGWLFDCKVNVMKSFETSLLRRLKFGLQLFSDCCVNQLHLNGLFIVSTGSSYCIGKPCPPGSYGPAGNQDGSDFVSRFIPVFV